MPDSSSDKARKVVFFMTASIPLLLIIAVILYKMVPQLQIVFFAAILIIVIAAANLILNIISIFLNKNLSFPVKPNFFLTRVLTPPAFLIARVFLSQDAIHRSFITYNNKIIRTKNHKFKPEEILILLPRCIQNTDCKQGVVQDITHCVSCGKCDVSAINKILKDTGIKGAVVTGGTQARVLLNTLKPKAVIAVACERDLVSGIFDSNNKFVYGLLNERPNGPCFNTRSNMAEVRSVIEALIDRRTIAREKEDLPEKKQ